MSDEMGIEKIDLDKVDWRGSRDFFESLGEALDKLDDKDESYDFTWVGKRKSIIEAGAPINKTLRPDVANSKNWDTTENLFIEGDNLDALKLLQESYLGKVKMIYIDPPYNTGRDFVYHDDFRTDVDEYDESTEYKDQSGNIQFKKNDRSNGRYHSDWLSMMYPRLKLARNLLSGDGVVFISIDDNEQANLKKLCDEVFGEDNFVADFIWQHRKSSQNDTDVSLSHNYTLCFARDRSTFRVNPLKVDDSKFTNPDNDPRGLWVADPFDAPNIRPNLTYPIVNPITGEQHLPPGGRHWRFSQEKFASALADNRVVWGRSGKGRPQLKRFLSEAQLKGTNPFTIWTDAGTATAATKEMMQLFGGKKIFDTPKPVSFIRETLLLGSKKDSIVLDFFSGSGTTAHAAMQLNAEDEGTRKWIMVQLPEDIDEKAEAYSAGFKTIPEIARERIRRAGDKIATEHPDAKVDYGFRALRIDDTNYKEVYKSAGEQQQSTLLNLVDNIKDDRSELDLLYGVITQSALELNRPLETREIAGSNVFLYDYFGEVSGLVACFGDSISEETIKEIAKLKPLTAVFRDSTFPDSQAKVNLGEHFRILSAETKVKVI
jgi:adenine-specific DNA-methyltransferase